MEKIRKTSFNKYFNKAFKDITGFDENEKKVIYEIFWNFITEHRIDRYFMDNHPIKDKFLCKDWTWKWYNQWEERFAKDGYKMYVRDHKKSKQYNMYWGLITYIFEQAERDSEAKELKMKFKVDIESVKDSNNDYGKQYILEILSKNPNALPPFFPFDYTVARPIFDDIDIKKYIKIIKKYKT